MIKQVPRIVNCCDARVWNVFYWVLFCAVDLVSAGLDGLVVIFVNVPYIH